MPYETHLQCDEPQDERVLWRYMPLDKFLAMLKDKGLFFAAANRQGDPYEGSVPQLVLEQQIGRIVATVEAQNDAQRAQYIEHAKHVAEQRDDAPARTTPGAEGTSEFERGLLTISCWHANESESQAMWKLYAGAGNGVAIRTTFADFKASVTDTAVVSAGMITYRNYHDLDEEFPLTNPLQWMLSKDSSFEHESEMRAFCRNHTDAKPGEPIAVNEWYSSEKAGHAVSFDLSRLLCGVVVAPGSDPWFAGIVQDALNQAGLKVAVEQSRLSAHPTFMPREPMLMKMVLDRLGE